MDAHYKPQIDSEVECKKLEKNYVTCLNENSEYNFKVPRKCQKEQVFYI